MSYTSKPACVFYQLRYTLVYVSANETHKGPHGQQAFTPCSCRATSPRLSACVKCGTLHMRHRMCAQCGSYKGREVIDVLKKVEKKEDRKKAKMKAMGLEEKEVSETPEKLDAEKLSNK